MTRNLAHGFEEKDPCTDVTNPGVDHVGAATLFGVWGYAGYVRNCSMAHDKLVVFCILRNAATH